MSGNRFHHSFTSGDRGDFEYTRAGGAYAWDGSKYRLYGDNEAAFTPDGIQLEASSTNSQINSDYSTMDTGTGAVFTLLSGESPIEGGYAAFLIEVTSDGTNYAQQPTGSSTDGDPPATSMTFVSIAGIANPPAYISICAASASSGPYIIIDPVTGEVVGSGTTSGTLVDYRVTKRGDWWEVSIATDPVRLFMQTRAENSPSFQGGGTIGTQYKCAFHQVEFDTAFTTSPITGSFPVQQRAQTRCDISVTDMGLRNDIRSNFTVVASGVFLGSTKATDYFLALSDGSISNYCSMYVQPYPGSALFFRVNLGGSVQWAQNAGLAVESGVEYDIRYTVHSDRAYLFVNGKLFDSGPLSLSATADLQNFSVSALHKTYAVNAHTVTSTVDVLDYALTEDELVNWTPDIGGRDDTPQLISPVAGGIAGSIIQRPVTNIITPELLGRGFSTGFDTGYGG